MKHHIPSKPDLVLQLSGCTVRRNASFTLEVKNLLLNAGQVACVAGANGSGKTTLIETVVGLLPTQEGFVRIMGRRLGADSLEVKRLIGFIPDDEAWIISELTAREYFQLLEAVYKEAGVTVNMSQRVETSAQKLLFSNFDQQLVTLSHGNKKKVQIIAGLMHQPALLVVDELRNGLDPIAIRQAEELLKQQAGEGTAILAATHDLWWAERFADDIVMLGQGKIILQARTSSIKSEAGSVEAKFLELYGAASE